MTRTLKDLKAAIQPGVRIRIVDHWLPKYVGTERVVKRVQADGQYTFDVDGRTNWGKLGKRRELTFNPDGTVTFRPEDGQDRGMFWTFEVVNEEVAA